MKKIKEKGRGLRDGRKKMKGGRWQTKRWKEKEEERMATDQEMEGKRWREEGDRLRDGKKKI
jgi:hypothetical protein